MSNIKYNPEWEFCGRCECFEPNVIDFDFNKEEHQQNEGFCRKFNKYVASVAVCNSFKRLKSNEEKEKGKRKESSVRKAVQYIYENEDDSLADAIVSQLETAWEDGYNTAKKDKL